MSNKSNLIGAQFGQLVVLAETSQIGTTRMWICLCSCGTETTVRHSNLVTGNSKSCGCLRNRQTQLRSFKHGYRHKPEYVVWTNMKTRCFNPKATQYHNYGGRGITVCDQWRNSFETFLSDVGDRPSEHHSLERIDVNDDYKPSNCKWATWEEQCNNRTNSAPTCPTCKQKVYKKLS